MTFDRKVTGVKPAPPDAWGRSPPATLETMSTPPSDPAPAVSWDGVLAAADAIAASLPPTPAWTYPLLDELVGATVVLKHENTQPTGAFKVRGGLAFVARLDPAVRHLVTASTGNHAQSVAYAARSAGLRATVVMPTTAPANKIAATRALGAEVVVAGPTMTEAVAHARVLAADGAGRFVDPGGEPDILHGHATVFLELLRAHPDLEALYVPVGSGTGAAGACVVRDAIAPGCRVIAVQSAQAPAVHDAWRAREPRSAACTTRASGLATAASFAMTQAVLLDRLDEFLLVDDDDLDEARRILVTHAHTLAEGAGAAALAGLLADPHRPAKCAIVISGGNADEREIATLAGI